jgi:hypothetical protein
MTALLKPPLAATAQPQAYARVYYAGLLKAVAKSPVGRLDVAARATLLRSQIPALLLQVLALLPLWGASPTLQELRAMLQAFGMRMAA